MAGTIEISTCSSVAIPGILPTWPVGKIEEKTALTVEQIPRQMKQARAGMNKNKTGESHYPEAAPSFEHAGIVDFGALYEKFKRPIHTYVYRMLNSFEDADDITQEVFTRAYLSWNDLYDRDNLSPWLYRIATNLCVDALRRRKRVSWWPLSRSKGSGDSGEARQEDEALYLPSDNGGIPAVGERELIQKTLAQMPRDYAIALVLSAAQGISYQEIASIVGISPNAAATRISRAKRIFAELYEHISNEGIDPQERKK
jgi:RNA polymerase sigma-70 factor, ECF subfamily